MATSAKSHANWRLASQPRRSGGSGTRAAQLAPLVLAASGLTARERQIARMLLRGDATEQIARHLVISRHTLRDHVRAIYAKLGVAGRPEFTALLLHEEEIPHQGDSGRGGLRPA